MGSQGKRGVDNKLMYGKIRKLFLKRRATMTDDEWEVYEYITSRYFLNRDMVGTIYFAQEIQLMLDNGEYNPKMLEISPHIQLSKRHDVRYRTITCAMNRTMNKNNRVLKLHPYQFIKEVAKKLMYPELKDETDNIKYSQELPSETLKLRVPNDQIKPFERLSNYIKDDKIVIDDIEVVYYGGEAIVTCYFKDERRTDDKGNRKE